MIETTNFGPYSLDEDNIVLKKNIEVLKLSDNMFSINMDKALARH